MMLKLYTEDKLSMVKKTKRRKKPKIKFSVIRGFLQFFGFSKTPLRAIATTLACGVSMGVAFEEMVGIGTWHSYHPPTDSYNVCFTPPSGCGSLIAQEISKARSSIHVQAYGLTSRGIIHQLKAAKKRGVQVNILLDGGQLSDNNGIFSDFRSAGIFVAFDKVPGIAHNKVMIIDKKRVITGSYNFTYSADEKNAENVMLIKDEKIAKKYLENWHSRREFSIVDIKNNDVIKNR